MTAHFPQPAAERLHGLDALRGFALLLGVIVHASMSFVPGAQYFWVAHDNNPNAWLSLAFYVPHMFRMLLFFLLAGFFGRMLCERLGAKDFARNRWKRIAVPLLVGWPLVFAAIVAVLVWGAVLANGGAMPKETPPGPAFTPDSFPLTHLWFLYALLLCYIAALGLRALGRIAGLAKFANAAADGLVRVFASPAGPLLLTLPLGAALFCLSKWYPWFGIPTPDQSLYPNLAACVGFGSAFAFGWLLHRQPRLLQAGNGAGRCICRWPSPPPRSAFRPRDSRRRYLPRRTTPRPWPTRSAMRSPPGTGRSPWSASHCAICPATARRAVTWPTRRIGST